MLSIFLIDLNPGYVVAKYELAKHVVEKVCTGYITIKWCECEL